MLSPVDFERVSSIVKSQIKPLCVGVLWPVMDVMNQAASFSLFVGSYFSNVADMWYTRSSFASPSSCRESDERV